jgi:3-hydroxybutyryl-CoA dehydrogenase
MTEGAGKHMNIGVIGAGTIGIGVAQSLSEASHRVILVDISQKALDRAVPEIKQALRLQRLLNKAAPGDASADEVLGRIERTTDLDALATVEFVVENVPERWATKRDLYHRLDALCVAQCIFAANTSCFSITRIANETKRPARVLGIHFMNPVPLKPAVEVIRGRETSDETLQAAQALLGTMRKRGIVVKDRPGFVSNRILMLTINEAICTVHEGVATVEQVDEIFKMCFGHKMGPLETADLIGLDTILFSMEVLHESLADEKYCPCSLLREMVDANVLGRKSGKGFYDYDRLTFN